jgi:GldM N-terminal domain
MNKLTILLLLLLVITYSCKQENEPYSMYGFLNEEFVYSSEMLKVQVAENLTNEKLINNESAIAYDTLTSDYLNYLDKTYSELFEKIEIPADYNGELSKKKYVNELFFDESNYNEKGAEFISKMVKYRTEILNLIKDKNLAKRVEGTLSTMDIQNREGKKFKYLTYLYHDMPLISVLTHIKSKEKSILEFENEFLKNLQLNE